MNRLLLLLSLAACSNGGSPSSRVAPIGQNACDYTNRFSQSNECRQFNSNRGLVEKEKLCADLGGTIADSCSTSELLGQCDLADESGLAETVFVYGEEGCDLQKTGCETFGGGVWSAAATCTGTDSTGSSVFIQPTLECRSPLPGEPIGQSENGDVCTWQAIAASTEEGRRFSDYASCDVVRGQRPYYPALPAETIGSPDERLEDPNYVAELKWVTSQIESSACICCHSALEAPLGTSNWYLEAPGNWLASMEDTGVALGANAIPSIAFGAYPPEDNNGFDRIRSGFPSTNPKRMVNFFVKELEYRGRNIEDFSDSPPFGGPLHDQIFFQPSQCQNEEGISDSGAISWAGGDARYLYILEKSSRSPTVPPNLDKPDGTIWRIDVGASESPLKSGSVFYGTTPGGARQVIPDSGAAPKLDSGATYYLYASLDVGLPITRCLFKLP